MALSDNLRRCRERLQLSITAISGDWARKHGHGKDACRVRWHQYESGRTLPSVETLLELAEVLGVEPGELLGDRK